MLGKRAYDAIRDQLFGCGSIEARLSQNFAAVLSDPWRPPPEIEPPTTRAQGRRDGAKLVVMENHA